MGNRLLKTEKERLEELIHIRMKLGVYARDDYGYIKLSETKDGRFTIMEHRRGRNMTNERFIEPEYLLSQVQICLSERFKHTPKYKPDQFGEIVNPATGQLYKEFNFNDWADGETADIAPVVKEEKKSEPSIILDDFFKNW